jgi:predicted glycogen debranching enzyme
MIEGRRLTLPWDPLKDPLPLRQREWLITNGLGGYASGTVAGIPSRKYHGLFVPNLSAPKGRHILISRCDEVVIVDGKRMLLGGAEFADEQFVGEAHLLLKEFRLDDRIAVWLFRVNGTLLEKSIVMVHNQNTVCVQYRVLAGDPVDLQIRPYVSFRRHDESPDNELARTFVFTAKNGQHEISADNIALTLRMGICPPPSVFVSDEHREREFVYRIDRSRGDSSTESAYSPGYYTARVTVSDTVCFFASTQSWERLTFDVSTVFDAERKRIGALLALSRAAETDDFAQQLVMAADQFIVLPGSRLEETVMAEAEGTDLRTVYAGYHWFGDWGRDTMISLEGLALCTGRYREAGAILRTFAQYVKDGLLPNLFPEGERQALYHTVDATLWYFHAISRYVEVTGDRTILTSLMPILQSIVEHHVNGTHFGIHVDPADGLISAAAEGYQLTWMDAKVDGWVVTPRRGKPVEIQALWFNALTLMSQWARDLQLPTAQYEQLAAQVRDSFNARYWNESTGCLFDVIDGANGNDPAVRPNQVFAISLPHPVLFQRYWRPTLDVVRDRLLTPFGLRTLSSDHPDYKRHYRGDLRARDAAYHQGTVWPWLIGHYVDALLKVQLDPAAAHQLLQGFREHLFDAGVGSISEIFDAEPPFAPGGCIAQAWSVAEVLRVWLKTVPT